MPVSPMRMLPYQPRSLKNSARSIVSSWAGFSWRSATHKAAHWQSFTIVDSMTIHQFARIPCRISRLLHKVG